MEENPTNSNSNFLSHSDYIFKQSMQQRREESEEYLIKDEFKVKITDCLPQEREIQTESNDRNTQERDSNYEPEDEGRVLFIEQKSSKLTKIIR
jgi:hypothetical protein